MKIFEIFKKISRFFTIFSEQEFWSDVPHVEIIFLISCKTGIDISQGMTLANHPEIRNFWNFAYVVGNESCLTDVMNLDT